MRRRASLQALRLLDKTRERHQRIEGRHRICVHSHQFFDDRVRRGAEQGELIHGRGWRRPRSGSPGEVLALQTSKNSPCPRDDRLRQTGETSDVDAVRTVCSTRLAR